MIDSQICVLMAYNTASMEIVTHVQEKPSLAEAEDAKKRVITEVSHYEALSEEEKALDKRVNLKLDFILLLILAIGFIVRCYRGHAKLS